MALMVEPERLSMEALPGCARKMLATSMKPTCAAAPGMIRASVNDDVMAAAVAPIWEAFSARANVMFAGVGTKGPGRVTLRFIDEPKEKPAGPYVKEKVDRGAPDIAHTDCRSGLPADGVALKMYAPLE